MIRRAFACLTLLALLFHTGAIAYACGRMGASGHGPHAAMAMESHAAGAHQSVPPPDRGAGDRERGVSDQGDPMPDHCNRFHRADCPHRGAAFHPCPDDQPAGLQAVDAGLPTAPEAPVFGLARLAQSSTPAAPVPATPGFSPDRPPPRAI